MSVYYIAYATLALIIAAFVPAMIAACKERHFSKWYIYAVFLFPAALFHSIALKTPRHCIGVFFHDKNNPTRRKKQIYNCVPAEKQHRIITPSHICAVFFSKLIFGAFAALALFAVFRIFVHGTDHLRAACVIFAVIFSVMMSIVEICRFSRIPMIADEITKRALLIAFTSVVCSFPLFLMKTFILDKTLAEYSEFFTFACAVVSIIIFILALLRRQSIYYTFFSRFFDYCIISMFSYAIYAAITLLLLSTREFRVIIHAVAMPMQVLNLQNLAAGASVLNLSYIYSSALAHLVVEIVILFSGLLCRDFKRKELAARIEYRSAAFRMSRKRILRRHIPKMDAVRIRPLQNV